MEIGRREVLKSGALLVAGAAVPNGFRLGSPASQESWIDAPASECPVDTVVVCVLENRSFDHMLGWLGTDEAYSERGRRRYGSSFSVDATVRARYRDPAGREVPTYALVTSGESNPWRGCGHPVPGHGWGAGRVQLDDGFLAAGSGNDAYALGYFRKEDLPVYARLAEGYLVQDAYFSSLLGETLPNRQYLHSATSGGEKDNPTDGLQLGQWTQETIWDRLERAGVSARYYYSDFPYLLGFGERMSSRIWPIDRYLEECATGTLPQYSFLCPQFGVVDQSDGHPRGDVNLMQRYLLAMFQAFASSPQWHRGMFVLAHDEWGGFWDHVRPPRFPDARSSPDLYQDFGQAGFRVPSIVASPWVASGSVSSAVVDHATQLRFLEWRFLGAPARGRRGARWWLTERDRGARNLGEVLTRRRPRVEVPFDLDIPLPATTPICTDEEQLLALEAPIAMRGDPEYTDYVARHYPRASVESWVPPDEPAAEPTGI